MVEPSEYLYRQGKRGGKSAEEFGSYEIERIKSILEILPDDAKSVIDLGCGEGLVTNQIIQDDSFIVGYDVSLHSLNFIKSTGIQGSITKLPFSNNSFDLVISSSVLEHLNDQVLKEATSEMKRISGRYILISTPYKEKLWIGRTKCSKCGSIFHKNLHLRSIDKSDICNLFPDYYLVKESYSGFVEYRDPTIFWFAQNILNRYSIPGREILCPVCNYDFSKYYEHHQIDQKDHLNNFEKTGKLINSIIGSIFLKSKNPTHINVLLSKNLDIEQGAL